MTSLLSLPLHHLLFSVWAAHLPMSPLPPLIWAPLVVSPWVGSGWRQGRGTVSSEVPEEVHPGLLGVVCLGRRPSLCPLKTTAGGGGGRVELPIRNHQY